MHSRAACSALLLISLLAQAADPVRLMRYPQKLRTFYAIGDPAVPAALRLTTLPEPAAMPRLPANALPGDVVTTGTASDGAIWLGTRHGLVRYDARAAANDHIQYFAGHRYLPDDDVRGIAPDASAGVWVRTATGVSHIELRPMTMNRKADWFEKAIRERHDRYGMVSSSLLREPGVLATSQLEPSDNDGLWTAMYAAAECFRYSVTGSPEALANAKKSIDAVLFLEEVTGRPGFPARSYIRAGDWRPMGGVWHWTADGKYEWKGDTSSDEIVGHYFAFGIAYDLLPDAALKKRIVATVTRITDHILDHGYTLTDVTGKPTYWGYWSTGYFESQRGRSDSPLNALELLSFLKTAAHITGQTKYQQAYRKVALDLKYLEQATRYLELHGAQINYSDEELAMLPFYLAFRYETDAKYLQVYRRALAEWWQNIQREKNPLWTLIYLTSAPSQPVDVNGAVWTLYRIPLDLIEWTVVNSNRKDVIMDASLDRFRRPQSITLLPPDERPVMKWNGNPFRIDGGNGGRAEEAGTFFLLPYWMGRYHRFLAE